MTGSPGKRLLAWYGENRRDLPWRRSRDPYAIWISEVMLQQTRVNTVVSYYLRFLERFPSVADLAAANESEVLSLWSGLGYYRRARQLLCAARMMVDAGGRFPSTSEDLRRLPGVGPYTAAAIASMAFDEKVAVLDGNVERVVSRLFGLDGDPKRAAGRRELAARADGLLDSDNPGDSNQALMELGATLCTLKRPDCPACPLSKDCFASSTGRPESYPRARSRVPTEKRRILVAVVRRGERFLFVRRPEDSRLLAGMWELPWVELANDDSNRAGSSGEDLGRKYGGTWVIGDSRGRVKHSITRYSLDVDVAAAGLETTHVSEGVEAGWFRPAEIDSLPHSSLVRKALDTGKR